MKIGVDSTALTKHKTGVGNYIYELLIRLVKRHPNWQFILYSNDEIVFPHFGNVIHRVSKPKLKGPAWQNIQLVWQLFSDKPDVFWGGNGYLPLLTPSKTTTLVTIHDLVYLQASATLPWFSRYSRQFFQPRAVAKADKVISVSNSTNSEMITHYARSADIIINPQLRDIYHPADSQEKIRVQEKYRLPKNFFLVIGTLEPRKNLPTLVKAYVAARESGFDLPLLAIAGGKGWLSGDLPKLVSLAEEKGFVKKLGYVDDDDMCGLYSAASLFILPSIYEGFGMPVVEAQLCGTPVAISNIPSLKEAAAGEAIIFEPSEQGILGFLEAYSKNNLTIKNRVISEISNNPEKAADDLYRLINWNKES